MFITNRLRLLIAVSERNVVTATQHSIRALQVRQAPVQAPHAGSYLTLRQPSCGVIMYIKNIRNMTRPSSRHEKNMSRPGQVANRGDYFACELSCLW